MPNVQLRNTLLLMGASFIWGTAFVAQSVGADHMGPYSFLAGRSWLACVFLLGLMAVLRKAGPLTDAERDIVFNGPAVKKHILYKPKKGNDFAELDFTYFNAVYTVENALAKAKDEKGIKRVSRFLSEQPCPDCSGTRLSQQARQPQILGINLAQATAMTLDETLGAFSTQVIAAGDACDGHSHLRIVRGYGRAARGTRIMLFVA